MAAPPPDPRPEPPSDYEAEKKVIGCMLLRPEGAGELAAKLRQSDFTAAPLGEVFAAITDLAALNRPITTATVVRQMPPSVLADFGGEHQVVACMEGVLPAEGEYWADHLLALTKARKLLKAGEMAVRLARGDPKKVDEALAKVEATLSAARANDDSLGVDMMAGVQIFRERMERYLGDPNALAGLSTGWRQLDRTLDGLRPGAVITVYSESGRYKSFFATNLGWNLARNAIPGYWIVTEMQTADVMERLLSLEAGLDIRELRFTGQLRNYAGQVEECGYMVEGYPIEINDTTELDVAVLKSFVALKVRTSGIRYVIIDLLDHVRAAKMSGIDEEEHVMYQMKDMAKRHGITVILLSHVRKRDRFAAPTIVIDPSELKGTSSKWQDSDALISLVPVIPEQPGAELQAFPPKPMTYDQFVEAQRNRDPIMICAGVSKNRYGPMRNLFFEIDPVQGGRISPLG